MDPFKSKIFVIQPLVFLRSIILIPYLLHRPIIKQILHHHNVHPYRSSGSHVLVADPIETKNLAQYSGELKEKVIRIKTRRCSMSLPHGRRLLTCIGSKREQTLGKHPFHILRFASIDIFHLKHNHPDEGVISAFSLLSSVVLPLVFKNTDPDFPPEESHFAQCAREAI
jgi:hypothetical protein